MISSLRLFALVLAASTLTLAGCGASSSAGPGDGSGSGAAATWDQLSGRSFVSTAVTHQGEPYQLVEDSVVHVTFTDKAVSANAGCNTMSGGATIDGGKLTVAEALAMTQMGCDAPLMEQDRWLAETLQSRPALSLDGDHLRIAGTAYQLDLVDRSTAEPDKALEGTTWSVTGAITGSGEDASISSVPPAWGASVKLTDGQLHATAGCNQLSGTYVLDGSTLTVSHLMSTQMLCPGAKGKLENLMTQVLRGTVTVAIDGDQLVLTNGEQGLTLTAGPATPER